MAWYYGEYACGHEGRVNIIGPVRNRQWKMDKEFSKLCPDCYKKQLEQEREMANLEALKKAKEMDLPQLIGSPKQIAWANTLRQEFIEVFDNMPKLGKNLERWGIDLTEDEVLDVRDYILENRTSANYFIKSREEIMQLIESEAKEALKTDEEKHIEREIEQEKQDGIIYPENKQTDVAVEIEYTKRNISLKFEKNQMFIDLVKVWGYRWDRESKIWYRTLDYTTGTFEDRVAEIGNKLLNAGFPVMILDENIRNKAINGEYEPECHRWIYLRGTGDYKGWFDIRWRGRDDVLYQNARKLPGSRWDSAVMVRLEYCKEVEEFAELYGFKFSKGAMEAIKLHKEKLAKIEPITPVEVEGEDQKDGLKEILKSSNKILDDLKEEE